MPLSFQYTTQFGATLSDEYCLHCDYTNGAPQCSLTAVRKRLLRELPMGLQ
jgi:hypothetical protein